MFFLLSALGWITAELHAEELCAETWLARRLGRDAAWVELSLERDQVLVVPRAHWVAGLRSGRSRCGDWVGQWSIRSFPVNLPGQVKEVRYRYRATRLPLDGQTPVESVIARVELWRESVSESLKPMDSTGVWRKLVLNESSEHLDGDRLRLLGFVHLLTSSGIHLYALASWIAWLLSWACTVTGFSAVTGWRIARTVSCIAWVAVWLLNGARPGMLRPLVVVGLRTLARSQGWKWKRFWPLAIALSIDLLIALAAQLQGEAEWAPGRMHYALAVAGGLWALDRTDFSDGRSKRDPFFRSLARHVCEHGRLALGSWWLTAVWDVFAYGTLSPLTPLVSWVTIPVFALGVFPVALMSTIPAARGVLSSADAFLAICVERLESLDSVVVFENPLSCGLIAISSALVVVSFRSRDVRTARVLPLLLLAFVLISRVAVSSLDLSRGLAQSTREASWRVEQLDVGQGDAALVTSAGVGISSAGLIDAGSERAIRPSGWIRLLGARGVHELDWIALTHLDEDHAGGVKSVVEVMRVDCVAAQFRQWVTVRGRALSDWLRRRGVRVVSWDVAPSSCVPIPARDLSAPGSSNARDRASGDGNSLMSAFAVPLSGGGWYVTLGDADREQEQRALDWLRVLGVHQGRLIFKVSHHGSRFSSDMDVLRALKIDNAWISSGLGNRYGHPSAEVTEKLLRARIPVQRTDQRGALHFDRQD